MLGSLIGSGVDWNFTLVVVPAYVLMVHPPINDSALQILLKVFHDSPIHLNLELFLQCVFLAFLLGTQQRIHSLKTLLYPLSVLTRNLVRARTMLSDYPRVSDILLPCFTLPHRSPRSRKGVHISSIRTMLVSITMLYASSCVFTVDALRHTIVTSRDCTTLVASQIYSTEYTQGQNCFDYSNLFASKAKAATLVINVSRIFI